MKVLAALIVLAAGFSANALDYTVRGEIRDSMTASSSCGTSTTCSAQSTVGVGVGVTSDVWSWSPGWALQTGGMIRNRVASVNVSGSGAGTGTLSVNGYYLDIPVEVEWTFVPSVDVRLGVDLGIKLSTTDTTLNNTSYSTFENDNGFIVPVELAFDWKFMPSQLVYLAFETGTGLAQGQNSNSNLATSSVIFAGYGYTF